MAKQGDIVIIQNQVAVVIREHATGEVDLHLFSPGNPIWRKVTLPASTTSATGGSGSGTAVPAKA